MRSASPTVSPQLDTIPMAKPLMGEYERQAVQRVLASGQLVQGQEVAAFEAEFSHLVDRRRCVAVSSGTSALHLGLLAAGVRNGDEVIVPSFTFAATANAVIHTGARPVFVDIDPDTYCLDPAAVEAAITPRTVGIMPVHLYGHPADMTRLQEIASRHQLAIFEDACQAHMASWGGRPVGTFGEFAAFSFYATKNMTTGEGGMVVCANEHIAHRVRLLRNQGMAKPYANELIGYNARMTDIAAAIGRAQLVRLPEWTARRQANAATLDAILAETKRVTTPRVASGAVHAFHQYTIRVVDPADGRDLVRSRLKDAGIHTNVYYPTPVHRLPAYIQAYGDVRLPATERACAEVVSLPVHPALSDADIARVGNATLQAVTR
ncbi:MAG TPA: DegT/DnrJ/EryC1/StrS family aminotransferase [Actinopolymorphaceae bacterium]